MPPNLKLNIILKNVKENDTLNNQLQGIDVHNMMLKFVPKLALSWQDQRVIFPTIRSGEQKVLNGLTSRMIWIPKVTVTGRAGDLSDHGKARK